MADASEDNSYRSAPVRDRRGRGMRGPAFAPPTPSSPLPVLAARVPAHRTAREDFDRLAVGVVADIESRWPERLCFVELAVEEIPLLPSGWNSPQVPMASMVPGTARAAPRLVLFRQPIELRAEQHEDLVALVLTVAVEQLAGFLGVAPEDVHPDYDPDPDPD